MLGPRLPSRFGRRLLPRAQAALETLEVHVPRHDGEPPLDLVLSLTRPRRGHGRPYLDVGLLHGDGAKLSARSRRADSTGSPLPLTPPLHGAWRAAWPGVGIELLLAPIAHRGGVTLTRATGTLQIFDGAVELDDEPIFLSERRSARRPYAWTRATLRGEIDGDDLVCVVETARRRAGSVVLPELGRIRLFGPGARALPRDCIMAPLPIRAEYGTGRLRAAALSPTHRLLLELAAPPDATALFEMVDPDGEPAYAHRAADATATLTLTRRKKITHTVNLSGRFEWGARAGDPRVAHRAWRQA